MLLNLILFINTNTHIFNCSSHLLIIRCLLLCSKQSLPRIWISALTTNNRFILHHPCTPFGPWPPTCSYLFLPASNTCGTPNTRDNPIPQIFFLNLHLPLTIQWQISIRSILCPRIQLHSFNLFFLLYIHMVCRLNLLI